MTDTAFYDSMNALANEMLVKFGSPATLRRITVGDVGADGKATKTTTDHAGLAVVTSSKTVLDNLSHDIQAALVLKATTKPKIGDHVIHAGTTWEIKDVKEVNPEGTRLILSFVGVVRPHD